jgi:hypothetical protein
MVEWIGTRKTKASSQASGSFTHVYSLGSVERTQPTKFSRLVLNSSGSLQLDLGGMQLRVVAFSGRAGTIVS